MIRLGCTPGPETPRAASGPFPPSLPYMARNGFATRSSPMVVHDPWPG
ncbi:hypothetical protein HRbin22_01992 [Candidatus Thermoflexus japonica]|uniref:Uncharacterized protein n=1 Tax=Candidatus Thermoflexus japonica TaxID=2035417 RepID=A0A2H5Y8H2_9CHLR|nr:hypothetical protein HRbin22_01992 [Candidatus Thermoflexus japonica]